ncbi:unnamed protein product, partial [marine sediment metagenome]
AFTYAKIGRRFGVSKERVRQLLMGNPSRQEPDLDSKIMLTAKDVGWLLGIHTNTVRHWSNNGLLKSYRIGLRGDRRFRREDIDCFLKEEKLSNIGKVKPEDQDYKLWLLLKQATDAILRVRQKELNQYNITTSRAAALFVIEAIGDKTTISEISRWLFRELHSVSRLLSRMEKEGLVKRVKDPDMKKAARIMVTEKGQQAYSQSTKMESIHEILSCLSEEEHQQMVSSLQILRDKALKWLASVAIGQVASRQLLRR